MIDANVSQPAATSETIADAREQFRDVLGIAARFGAAVCASAVVLLPLAATEAVESSAVHTSLGPNPVTVRFTGNGTSSLRSGILDSLYTEQSWHGIGMTVQVDGSGTSGSGSQSLAHLFSANTLNTYAGLGHDKETVIESLERPLIHEAVEKMTAYDLIGAGVLGAFVCAMSYTPLGSTRQENGQRSGKKLLAWSLAGAAITSGSMYASHNQYDDFKQASPTAAHRYDTKSLPGVYSDSLLLQQIIDKSVPNVKKYYERGKEQGEEYTAMVTEALQAQRAQMAAPRDDEVAILALADNHSNEPMIRTQANFIDIFNDTYGEGAVNQILSLGDTDYGTSLETYYRSLYHLLTDRAPMTGVTGNHDIGPSTKELEKAGVSFVNGKVVDVDGTTILGMGDPSQTVLFGGTTLKNGVTEQEVGEKLRSMAEEEHPDLTEVHEGYAAAAMIDRSDIHAVMDEPSDYTTPYMDGIRDIPTSALLYGHWHTEKPFKMAYNSDGTWTVIFQLGTSGGAIADATLGRPIGLPYEPPRQEASFVMLFKNKTSGLITGAQLYRFDPNGTVTIEPRIDFGTLDGQPYEVDSSYEATVTASGEPRQFDTESLIIGRKVNQ